METSEIIFVETIEDLQDWLAKNYINKTSFWLCKWKKLPNKPYITYDEMVDELICFGWVDSLPKSFNEEKTMHRISPRNPKSNWSKVNKERVIRLTQQGKMKPSGEKLVALAKENGAWDFLNDVEALVIPDDLAKAFELNEGAKYYYERFPKSSKRNILEWIKNAKQSATRNKRIEEAVKKASQNIKANHPKGRDAGPKDK